MEDSVGKKPHLTGVRAAQWATYAQRMMQLMGLADWLPMIMDDPPDHAGAAACVESIYGKKVARIWLALDWEQNTPHKQREFMAHELIHCHFEQPTQFALDTYNRRFHKEEGQFIYDHLCYLMEFGVDGLAKAFAPHLPLPADVVPALGQPKEKEKEKEKVEGLKRKRR